MNDIVKNTSSQSVHKTRIVYDHLPREFKTYTKDSKCCYLVTHNNIEVYNGEDLNQAFQVYNSIGIKEIVNIKKPVKIKKKNSISKKQTSKPEKSKKKAPV